MPHLQMSSKNKVHVPTPTTTKQQQHNSSGNTQHFQHKLAPLLLFSALVVPQGAETRDEETSRIGKQVHQKNHTTTNNNNNKKASLNHFKVLVHD
jgi:hypothetical protein